MSTQTCETCRHFTHHIGPRDGWCDWSNDRPRPTWLAPGMPVFLLEGRDCPAWEAING